MCARDSAQISSQSNGTPIATAGKPSEATPLEAKGSTGALGFCLQPPMSYAMASYMYSQNNLELERFVLPSFSGESGASPAAQFCEYMHEVIA